MELDDPGNLSTNKRCGFLLIKKKRNCRLYAIPNKIYCAEHAHLEQRVDEETDKDLPLRIQCPCDPKHTVYAKNLEKHLKICNSRPSIQPPYYKLDVNASPATDIASQVKLKDLTEAELAALILKVTSIFEDKVPVIPIYREICNCDPLQAEINSPKNGQPARRHLIQIGRLLGILDTLKVFSQEETVFIEFGSGKGHVSYWLGNTIDYLSYSCKADIVLVDRESHRHKRDNKVKDTSSRFNLTRVRVDIKDLLLDKVCEVEKNNNIVGISKHLCGQATDLALKSLFHISTPGKLAGFVMATCCHHRCDWNGFVGRKFLLDWGLEEKDFLPLISLTSWAVCGTGTSKFKSDETDEETGTNIIYQNLGLTVGKRREIGYKAKRIIDQARVSYVQSCGLNCKLIDFASEEDTNENIVIVAHRSNISNYFQENNNVIINERKN